MDNRTQSTDTTERRSPGWSRLTLVLLCLCAAIIVFVMAKDDVSLKAVYLLYFIFAPRFAPVPWRLLVMLLLLAVSAFVSSPATT